MESMDEYYEQAKWVIHFKMTNGLCLRNGIMGNRYETVVPFQDNVSLADLYLYIRSIFFQQAISISHPPITYLLSLKPYVPVTDQTPYIEDCIVLPNRSCMKLACFLNDHIEDVSQTCVLRIPSYVIYVSPLESILPVKFDDPCL